MTYLFDDKQSVDLWYDDDGNFLRALPRPWTRAQRLVALEKSGGKTFGSPAVSARSHSSTITQLVMITTGGARRPQSGYLLLATPSESPACRCITVTIANGKDGTRGVQLTLGLLAPDVLKQGMIAVSTKQTPKQRWLQEIWQAAHALQDEKAGAEKLRNASLKTLDCSALEGLDKQKLVIMLLWRHWILSKATDEAKIADLKELGLPGTSDKGAMWSIINRMELKLCPVPVS